MLDGNWVTKLAKPEITHLRKREKGRERERGRKSEMQMNSQQFVGD